MEEFLTKEIVSTGDIRLGAFVFFENSNVYDYRPNWTPLGPITIMY